MIEDLRYLLQGDPTLYLGQVLQCSDLDEDKSEYLVMCKLLPDRGEVVAHATYSYGGGQEKPEAGDIVLVVFPAAEADYALAIAVLPNTSRAIHSRTGEGDVVIACRPGKKTNIVSDTRVNIGKGLDTEEAEPLVLGDTLKTLLTTVLQKVETLADEVKKIADDTKSAFDSIKTGPVTLAGSSAGPTATALATALGLKVTSLGNAATAANGVKTDIENARDTYLAEADTNILSQIAFTERGAPE